MAKGAAVRALEASKVDVALSKFIGDMVKSKTIRNEEQRVREMQKASVASSQSSDVVTKQPEVSQQQLKELHEQYEAAERNVTELAHRIESGQAGDPDELTKLVQQAFDLRQKLQLAQVADGRAQLDAIEQRIQTRASIHQQMVARRVEELIPKSKTTDAIAVAEESVIVTI